MVVAGMKSLMQLEGRSFASNSAVDNIMDGPVVSGESALRSAPMQPAPV